ncbi:hypothetical protein AVEN_162814-1 [Araneus ventricosus]|uniref:Uncharacterized protein n=1 Tax=Araneus ventricosus TaxID=182803 RepID=A0A4Y2C6H5_ARAVE|nr:hypothetical protein AVEN_162814-1 [Araneus ventricosus]
MERRHRYEKEIIRRFSGALLSFNPFLLQAPALALPRGRGGLVIRSQLRCGKVPGSKPDSTEDPPSESKAGIPTNSKYNTSCADSNLWPRCEGSGTSKDLPRLGPHDEARKSEICRVGEEK